MAGRRRRESGRRWGGDQAQVWLKPEQVAEMRDATAASSRAYLAGRNDTMIALMYDTGLRVGETVALDVSMLDFGEGIVMLPARVQKGYDPDSGWPRYTEIEVDSSVLRTLRIYLRSRWKDSTALFPSTTSGRVTARTVRRMVKKAAVDAGVRPYTVEGRGDPEAVTPHVLRHSVSYRMLNREDATLYDVTKRLRHASITTTESVYSHFDRV